MFAFFPLGDEASSSKASSSSAQQDDPVALAEKRGKDLRQTLSKTQEALTHLHEVMLPGEDAPNTLERLANVFSACDGAIKDYSYMQTERGARSLISLIMAHGTKVDFEADRKSVV